MRYIQELDAVRGIAILSVVAAHWFPETSMLYKGATLFNGPNIFFTISGFLITRILLGERAKAENLAYSRFKVFRNFFLKRVLRIFPAYYLLLFVAHYLYTITPSEYNTYLTYTSNFRFYNQQAWGQLPHLWTMAVEEQFYLVWPWIILFASKKATPYIIASFFIIGFAGQLLVAEKMFWPILTFNCFDALAAGGLLAWALMTYPQRIPVIYKSLMYAAITSFVLLLILKITQPAYFLPERTLNAVIILWLLTYFVKQPHTAKSFGFLWRNRFLVLTGKMSYGIFYII